MIIMNDGGAEVLGGNAIIMVVYEFFFIVRV